MLTELHRAERLVFVGKSSRSALQPVTILVLYPFCASLSSNWHEEIVVVVVVAVEVAVVVAVVAVAVIVAAVAVVVAAAAVVVVAVVAVVIAVAAAAAVVVAAVVVKGFSIVSIHYTGWDPGAL